MRTELQGLEGQRRWFKAIFRKYGTMHAHGIVGKTILLSSVKDLQGRILADHIWINYTAGFDFAGNFELGDIVQFTAKVIPYVKGYAGEKIDDRLARPQSIDYRLVYPRNVQKMGKLEIIL